MNSVTLKINGVIDHNGTRVKSDILSYLSSQIRLETGYTLRSFFLMLDHYSLLVDLNPFFPECTEQYRQCPPHGCTDEAADFLEFSKTVEMIGFPEKKLEIYNSFSRVHENGTFEIRSAQLENLLDIPVRLGRLKHVIFGDPVDIFEFDTVFTLFEFIDGIAWQLSFHVIPTHCEI
ncbi:hypothetical protein D1AOALGA4SA_2419 [Olavius algarvensis Delta 1 endosymbiont]|nr:hypothetical protein D1AOALGA4SA_2419 [Olavius algarvensis Delta 1 endosymbiont]